RGRAGTSSGSAGFMDMMRRPSPRCRRLCGKWVPDGLRLAYRAWPVSPSRHLEMKAMAPGRKDSPLTLACILITILLDMVGYGIIVPVLPELIKELTGGSVAQAAMIGGWLVFAYALTQFV